MTRIGDEATLTRTITSDDVKAYADIVGDHNPVHLDAGFAAKTRFGRPIVHGMLVASLISSALGTKLPGPGTIYIRQALEFKAPVFVGDTVTVHLKVIEARADKPILTLATRCDRADGVTVVAGEAVVLAPTS